MLNRGDSSNHPDVMVSSTYRDLSAHRETVCDALLRLGFFPVGMEYDSAKAGKDVIASSLDMVAKVQAYIGIIGHRYGGVPHDSERNPDELSITELEYREALKRNIPVFMFLMSDDHAVKRQDVETAEVYQAKLQALKADARQRSISPAFSSVEELKSLVLQSMSALRVQIADETKLRHRPTNSRKVLLEVAPPNLLAVPNFIPGHEFIGRREELASLNKWASSSSSSLLVIEAIGGAGKSTLAWQWLTRQSTVARPDFAGRLWYSFYEGGADMTDFAARAFTYVTGEPLAKYRGWKIAEIAGLLLNALREKPFLLMLDGLERVLVAYHRLDASQARDDEVASGRDDRACIKPSDSEFLRQLVTVSPSKILITTRLMPTTLLNKSGQLLPGASHHMLKGLHPEDALEMMCSVRVKGEARTIKKYLTENFDNHPQIVGVVAGLVKDYIREPGNFDRWLEDPQGGASLHLAKLDLIQRQTHILAAALGGLNPGVRQVLSRIAAIGYAVPFETVEALNPFMPRPPQLSTNLMTRLDNETSELTKLEFEIKMNRVPLVAQESHIAKIAEAQSELAALEAEQAAEVKALEEYHNSKEFKDALPRLISALRDLEQRGLLQWDRDKNTYDLHPVVRGYAFDALEQPERVDICGRIADHFRSRPKDRYSETKTLADVQQSMNIFRALVQANRLDQAVQFYMGDFANALSYSIEAYHEILALLKPLFPNGFAQPPAGLNKYVQSYLLNNAAVALIMLGRLAEARQTLTVKLHLDVNARNWSDIRVSLTNLGETLREENKLAQSQAAFELASALANVIDIWAAMARSQWHLMVTYRLTGQFNKALAAYNAFRKLPTPQNRAIYRAGDVEGELCWLWFHQGKLTDKNLDEADAVARAGNNRVTLRSLFFLRGELALQRGEATAAITAFENAIEMAQAVGLTPSSSEARLALAKALTGEREAARDICDRLHELEQPPHVELAAAYLELGDKDKARQHALSGYSVAWADGPPHARWWELTQCRFMLKSLGQAEPQLPGFNPREVVPVPYEVEIRKLITMWKSR